MLISHDMPMPGDMRAPNHDEGVSVRSATTMSRGANRRDALLCVDPPGDDGELFARIDELLDAMEQYVVEQHGHDGAAWRSGDFTAGAMLEFKGRQGDGELTHWTGRDLREFMLVWFPAFVHADEEILADVPAAAAAFFSFLDYDGALTGDSPDELTSACQSTGGDFLAACRDPQRWSPAKARLIARSADRRP